ncbi:hypothetical protein [Phenylobacterium ferrooxidans]|uniref:Uncharacterized protein n=1 Tax=Phenylobacterium ferrooxidans TaxID=2982689 RepID=A0ABW6CQR6_9CAUL
MEPHPLVVEPRPQAVPTVGAVAGMRAVSILHWTMRPGQRGPYELRLVKATTWHDAAELLAPLDGGRVKECVTPTLLAIAKAYPDNHVWTQVVEQIPSVRDHYEGASGWSRARSNSEGFNVD